MIRLRRRGRRRRDSSRRTPRFHLVFFDVCRQPDARRISTGGSAARSTATGCVRSSCGVTSSRSIAEHKAILRAAKAGDVERTVHLVSEHIRVPQIRLLVEDTRMPRERAPVRRQSQQPGAADRSRLRPPDAARPLRGGRGVRLRLRVGGRQPLLEAPLRADRAAGGDLAANDTGEARHGVHGVVDAEPALSRARVGDARPDLGRPHDLRHGDGEPGGGCSARVRGARPRLRAARRRSSRKASPCCASSGRRAR